jgi:predicted small secreted protein
MHLLTTSIAAQQLKIVPRQDASSVTLELTDKTQFTTSTVSVSKTSSDPFMILSGSFSLVENRSYSFEVKDGSEVIYRGLIFCTDQTDGEKFFVQDGDYTSETSYDNEYVIL